MDLLYRDGQEARIGDLATGQVTHPIERGTTCPAAGIVIRLDAAGTSDETPLLHLVFIEEVAEGGFAEGFDGPIAAFKFHDGEGIRRVFVVRRGSGDLSKFILVARRG